MYFTNRIKWWDYAECLPIAVQNGRRGIKERDFGNSVP